jgi:tetratricopeptide (TPR) repeat protein
VHEPLGRLAELQRRVQSDPAPFVFAQLAEEYCRAGRFADAVACCRKGLDLHPGYLSARLILGRALVSLSRLEEAAIEYQDVVKAAPDNLAATRELADICDRLGRVNAALDYYRRALALARNDRALEASIAALSPRSGPGTAAVSPTAAPAPVPPTPSVAPAAPVPAVDFDAVLASLGHADQQTPPVIELLLTDPTALLAAPPSEPVVETGADDALGVLERELRERVTPGAGQGRERLDQERVESTPATRAAEPAETGTRIIEADPGHGSSDRSEPNLARIDAAIVADLEAWLTALARERASGARL